MPRILLIDAKASYAFNHRGAFIRALADAGYAVTVATSDFDADVAKGLSEIGVRFCRISFKPSGMNPFRDILFLCRAYALIRSLRPDVFVGVTIKPAIWGVMAAWLAGVPDRFALITGLGYAFGEGRDVRRRIANTAARSLFKLALRGTKKTIFENGDDKVLFTTAKLLKQSQAERINGTGIDLGAFAPASFPSGPFTFLMISRLLEDKGVREYANAAKIIKAANPETRFVLIGGMDKNPTAISDTELQVWVREGTIEYGGVVSDVRPAIAACHAFVLPSYYREGIPRTLMEALAMGRPVITTSMPGCRETVREGANGLLIPPRDASALASAELWLMSQDLKSFGASSRSLAEEKFDVQIVIRQLFAILTGRAPAYDADLSH